MSRVVEGERSPKPGAPNPGSIAAAARNLQQRVTSGVVMVFVALALVYAGPWPFALLLIAIGVLMSWEWGHLVRGRDVDAAFAVHGSGVAGAVVLAALGHEIVALAICVVSALVCAGVSRSSPWLSAAGVFYVGIPATVLVWLRQDESHGFAAVMFLFLIVWTTDTMAFAFGRAVGGPKLWPQISPNKTWAGFLGGVVSSVVAGAVFAQLVPQAMSLRLCAIGLVLGVVAQAGDLGESALKRAFGVKDASHIIPGHGGVMDRMDGIVAVAVAAGLLAAVFGAVQPASTLLIGR